MRFMIQKTLIWILSFSLILPSFSVSVYANELPQESEVSSLEESDEKQVEEEKTTIEEEHWIEEITGSINAGIAESEIEEDFVEESQYIEVDLSDKILHTGGLLDGENSFVNSDVSFFATEEELLQKEFVAELISAFSTYQTELDIAKYEVTGSQINEIIQTILNQNPRFFYVSGGFGGSSNSQGIWTKIYIDYIYDKTTSMQMLSEFDKAVNAATSKVSANWSDMEKALYIHSYLTRNCEYDYSYYGYSAYHALVNKAATCNGYALGFKALANELGLQCEVVTSVSLFHAWNMVLINDEFYHIDVTWDDSSNVVGYGRHSNFLKSTSFFQTEGMHLVENDWTVTNGWSADFASDTTYDEYFWNNVNCAFDYLNGYWYGFDGIDQIAKYSCDGKKFVKAEKLTDITDRWYLLDDPTNFYLDKYVGTGSYGNLFYYSTDDCIYAFNTKDTTISRVFQLTSSQISSSGYIYGINITPSGEIYYYQAPNLYTQGVTKKATELNEELKVYHIAFKGNGATAGDMKKLTDRIYGNTYQLPENGFVRSGYSFNGWNTKADGSGTAYKDKASVKNLTSTNGKTITLYAQWKKTKYKITYKLNGGTNNSGNPSGFYTDSNTITLKNPTRTGYIFKGWYSDSSYKEKVTEISKGSVGDRTLYAKWSVNKYKIAFNGNGNTSGSMEAMSGCKYGSSYTLTANAFKKKGYSFTGWNTKADGSGTTYKNKASVKNLTSANGKTITLYAQWKKATYTITYNLNGGKNNSKNPTSYTITTADIKLQNPSRTGYTFKGWYSDSEYTKKVTSIPKGSTGNKTLYAKWTANKYNIAFNGNKSTSGSMKTLSSCKYGSSYTLTANAFKRKGYSFTGWNTKADGSGTTYKNKTSVKNLTSTNGKTITLYAQWKKVNYSITYNLNGGKNNSKNPATYTVTTTDIKLQNPSRTGYTFGGWYSDSKLTKKVTTIKKGSTANKTLYAKWTANKYNIAFNGNKSTSGSMKTLSSCKYGSSYTLTANAFKKKGYSFTGWNTKADGSGTTYKNKASVKNLTSTNGKTITLYAQWKKATYSITYNLNGGKNNSKNPATYTVTTADIKLQNPTRTGYTFKGWYSDSKYTKKVTTIAKGSTGNKTLYAKWSKK